MSTIREHTEALEATYPGLRRTTAWNEIRTALGLNGGDGLYQVEDGWIETYTGEQFHFANPRPEEVHLLDIAHALAQTCRYNGHTIGFFSVAEHCVLMADHVMRTTGDRALALAALHHDDAEAYVGDLPRPIKHVLPAFKTLESGIDRVAAERFGLPFPIPKEVKVLDSRILRDERAQCMSDSGNEWGTDGLEPLDVDVRYLEPCVVEEMFIAAHEEYNGT